MNIRVYVDKVAALKAGTDQHGYMIIPIPAQLISVDRRNILARFPCATNENVVTADFYLDDESHLAKHHDLGGLLEFDHSPSCNDVFDALDQVGARLADIERGRGKMRTWAEENGSDALKSLIANNLEWEELAAEELVQANIEALELGLQPAGCSEERGHCLMYTDKERLSPEETQFLQTVIDRVQEVSEISPGSLPVKVEPVEALYVQPHDCQPDGCCPVCMNADSIEENWRSEIRMTFRLPDRSLFDEFFILEA
jgi:hypothetical protein